MFAIIETGGKQYKVQEGDIIYIERLEVAAGDAIKFDKVITVSDGDAVTLGAPYIAGAVVEGSIVKNGKGRKVRIFKYNAKKNYRKRQGHRQLYTKVQVSKISAV